MIWNVPPPMALKLESRKFKKVHGSSRKFTKVRSTSHSAESGISSPSRPAASRISLPVTDSGSCMLRDIATELLGVSGHEPNGRPGGLPMLWKNVKDSNDSTNASSINALYLAFSAISSASSSDTFLIASKLTKKEAKLGDLLTRGY